MRLDHAARLGQPLLVLVSVHGIQQVGVAGELDKIRMCGDQGLAPVDERVVCGEESASVRVLGRSWCVLILRNATHVARSLADVPLLTSARHTSCCECHGPTDGSR